MKYRKLIAVAAIMSLLACATKPESSDVMKVTEGVTQAQSPEWQVYDEVSPFGKEQPVYVMDDVRIKPGSQEKFLRLMESEYFPLAAERKMQLAGVWLFPPFEQKEKESDIVYLWRYETLEQFWTSRSLEETDARLPAFWRTADELIVNRKRRLGRPPALMTNTVPDQNDIELLQPVPSGIRHIAIIQPLEAISNAEKDSWIKSARTLESESEILISRANFHSDYSYFPGHFTWDIVTSEGASVTPDMLLSALPGKATIKEFVVLDRSISVGIRKPSITNGIKRTIFFRAIDGFEDADYENMENTLIEWAQQIKDIRAWSLSRTTNVIGSVKWTHCFEQEFTSSEVITSDYLYHPYHWSVADRLFGPEGQEKIVAEFIHTMRPGPTSLFENISTLK